MKKEGIVIKIDRQYLDVLMIEDASCCYPVIKNGSLNEQAKQHNCSSCSACSHFSPKKLKTVRVLNRSGKGIKVGERITYSFNFITLQFLIIVLLPVLSFALTFFFLCFYSYREGICILFSFLIFLLVVGINFFFSKKLFLPFV